MPSPPFCRTFSLWTCAGRRRYHAGLAAAIAAYGGFGRTGAFGAARCGVFQLNAACGLDVIHRLAALGGAQVHFLHLGAGALSGGLPRGCRRLVVQAVCGLLCLLRGRRLGCLRAVHGTAGALHLELQGIAVFALGCGAVGHGLALGIGQLTRDIRLGRGLLDRLLHRLLDGFPDRFRLGPGRRALADVPPLGRAHGLLHRAAAGVLFGQLLGAAAGSLVLLLLGASGRAAVYSLRGSLIVFPPCCMECFYFSCAFAYS